MLKVEIKNTIIEIGAGFFLVIAFMLFLCDAETVLLSLFSSFFHEAGHIAVILLCGEKLERLVFSSSGLRIDRRRSPSLSFSKEIIISLAGIIMNFIAALLSGLLYHITGDSVLFSLCLINVVIAAFNIMPIDSLDGGRALSFILSRRIPEERADRIVFYVSTATAFLLVAFFLLTVFLKKLNPSFLCVVIYLVILLINRFFELKKRVI